MADLQGQLAPVPPEALAGMRQLVPRVGRGERALLLADEPERVTASGVLYREVVSGAVRIYAYALMEAPQPLELAVVLRNPGRVRETVQLQRLGAAGPGAGFFQVGRAALEAWLNRGIPPGGGSQALSPGQSLLLWASRPVPAGQVVNAIIDAQWEAALEVSVVARRPAGAALPSSVLPPGQRPAAVPMRGTFAGADLLLQVAECAAGTQLRLAHVPSYLIGHSAVDAIPVVNYGNYGVAYDVELRASSPVALQLVFVPLGGGFCGALQLGQRVLPLASPSGRQLDVRQGLSLGRHTLSPEAPLHLRWMPPAASYLPAAVLFLP